MQVVISLFNNRGNYRAGARRLHTSLQKYWKGDKIIFNGEASVGAPSHFANNYAFKVYAFDEAIRRGYTQILWVDCSVFAVSDVQPAFDHISEYGYLMQDSGWKVGQWCNDRTLEYYGLTRERAMGLPMYGDAGLLGLDVSRYGLFLDKLRQGMKDGMFNGSWADFRHDMTLGSIIANLISMRYSPNFTWLQYSPADAPKLNESIIFYAAGL